MVKKGCQDIVKKCEYMVLKNSIRNSKKNHGQKSCKMEQNREGIIASMGCKQWFMRLGPKQTQLILTYAARGVCISGSMVKFSRNGKSPNTQSPK